MTANHELLVRRTSTDAQGDAATMLAKLEAAGSDLTILRYLANAPALLAPFVRFANALLNKSTLPRTTIEVVVLRIAQRLEIPYEWAEHVQMAAQAGVPASVVAAIERGDLDAAHLDAGASLAVAVADVLVDGNTVRPDLWRRCLDELGHAEATELLLVVGWFAGLVRTVLLGLQLEVPA